MDIVLVCSISLVHKHPGFKKVRDACFLLVMLYLRYITVKCNKGGGEVLIIIMISIKKGYCPKTVLMNEL